MDVNAFRRLYDYNRWANARVWDCVMQLDELQFTQPSDYSIGSVHAQIVHMMGADWLWLQRLSGTSPRAFLETADFPTREVIRAEWDRIEGGIVAYLDGLDDARLNDDLEYRSINGDAIRRTTLWEVLTHMVNHSTDHRAQVLAQIHRVGGPTLAQDLIFYTWEQRGQDAP